MQTPNGWRNHHAGATPELRMLRQGSAACGDGCDDLHLRVHLLPRLCGDAAWRPLPELRWQFREAADPARGGAREKSRIHRARVQATGMWEGSVSAVAKRGVPMPGTNILGRI